MTTIYFVRHAEADRSIRNGRVRPLTAKGMKDKSLVTDFLQNKKIDAVLSSPYKRAIDTVVEYADKQGVEIELIEALREQRSDSNVPRENNAPILAVVKQQWDDYTYKLSDGESLQDVLDRMIPALEDILKQYKGKAIVVGTHATALSLIVNHYAYHPEYGYEWYLSILDTLLPGVVKMEFENNACARLEKFDLFNPIKFDVTNGKCCTHELECLKGYGFVVIFARYEGKWLLCRKKGRNTYEIPGGGIDDGETAIDAARRELYEETGAIGFNIKPMFDYSYHFPTGFSNGQVFFAEIHELAELPAEFEMAEVKLFDGMPENMTYPHIQPLLFERIIEML